MTLSKTIQSLDRFRLAFWARDMLCWLAIIVLPWQARFIYQYLTIHGEPYEYGVLSLYVSSGIALTAAAFAWSLKKSPIFSRPWLWLIIAWLAVHVFAAQNSYLATYSAMTIMISFSYYCIVRLWSRVRAVQALVVTGMIQTIFAWYQFMVQKVYPSSILGVSPHIPGVLGESVVSVAGQRLLRAYGLLPHPNMLAALILFSFVALLYLYIVHQRDFQSRTSGTSHGLYVAGLLLLFSGLLITFSRAAFISLLVWITFLVLYGIFMMKRYVLVTLGRAVLWCGVLFFLFALATHSIWLQRFGIGGFDDNPDNERLEMISLQQRTEGYKQAWKLLRFPEAVIGVGLGNYIPELARKFPNIPAPLLQPVHNVYFSAIIEIGIVGALLLLGFLYDLFRHRFRRFGKIFDFHYFFAALLLLGFLGLFDHYLWTSYFGNSLWWLVVGLAAKND